MPAKVIVRDLRKTYGAVAAASQVSFQVHEGEIFGLLGPNGAGKTTTVECVIGLRQPDAGYIELFGIDARRHPAAVKQKLGATLQSTALQDKITPREALRVFASFYRRRVDAGALLERLALTAKADVPYDTLSGGQRQRLALALAFINDPELIFLDEPTTGLDPQSRRDLHSEIIRMKRDGRTVILTTHHIAEAEQLCDRIAIIDHGRVIAEGAPRDLIERSSAAATTVFLDTVQPLAREALAQVPGVQDLTEHGSGVRFLTSDATRTLAGLTQLLESRGIQIREMHLQKATLEDVLIELTGGGDRGA
ncbi:MAG: ABC transporter ATP-binding protein [Candidatus Solibacter sp.]